MMRNRRVNKSRKVMTVLIFLTVLTESRTRTVTPIIG